VASGVFSVPTGTAAIVIGSTVVVASGIFTDPTGTPAILVLDTTATISIAFDTGVTNQFQLDV